MFSYESHNAIKNTALFNDDFFFNFGSFNYEVSEGFSS